MVGESKNIDKLKSLYIGILKSFTDTHIKFVIFYGTLLGCIREKNFIDHDDDIDVLVNRNQKEELMNIIREKNIKTGIVYEDIVQLYLGDSGPFDIYFYDELKDDILIKWDLDILHSNDDMFPLNKITFHGHEVYVPNHPENILREIYGDKWTVPKIKGSKGYFSFAGCPRQLKSN